MNTKIGTSFGLALLMAIGVVSIMLVMGLFSPNKANAASPTVGSLTASPTNPGAVATIKLPFTLIKAVPGNSGEIWVKFDKLYGVPDTIAKTSISIASGQTTGGVSNPLIDPTIVTSDYSTGDYVASDQTVKIAIGDTNPNSAAATVENLEVGSTHTLTFASSAGITLPTGSGTAATNNIRLSQDSGATWNTATGFVTVREINLSATSGARGKTVTVTGKGFSGTGDATVWIDGSTGTGTVGTIDSGEFVIASGVDVSGGAFEVEFTTDVNFAVGAVNINAVDGTGVAPSTVPTFTTYGAVTTDLSSVARGSNLKISLAQWSSADVITAVSFGASGNTTTVDVAGNTTVPKTLTGTSGSFYVKVPVGTPLGSQKVTVTGTNEAAVRYTTVDITGAPVTVTPATGVDGQEVTVSGSGFTAGDAIATITVGGISVTKLSSGGLATTNNVTTVTADNSGNLTASFLLPNDAVLRTAGDHKIIITDASSRTGEVMVTVPGRTMTLDSTESKRGSTVNVTGTGFKAKASITIEYTNSGSSAVTVGTSTADALGNWSGSFVVPTTASIPSTNTVTGTAASGSSKTATHSLPGASIASDVSEQSTGETFTLTGESFPSYVSVTTITVGGIDAKPSPAPATDTNGDFSASIMVPGLTTGTHAISVTAGSVTASSSIEVVSTVSAAAAVSTETQDVFADSIAADNLVRVWKFSNADQSWSFYDPREAFAAANTLANTVTGDIVWVNVTAEESFQSGTLYPGWNLIALD
jgi:hypothetical protein